MVFSEGLRNGQVVENVNKKPSLFFLPFQLAFLPSVEKANITPLINNYNNKMIMNKKRNAATSEQLAAWVAWAAVQKRM